MPTMRADTFKTIADTALIAPRGLECVFEYKGLLLNDRRYPDHYRLTNVTGLDDADVRDSREANPDADGETPFGSRYGGRTIGLQGFIQAGNLNYLRYMWAQLKAATDDLTEDDLLLRWMDWRDDFNDTSALVMQDYVVDSGTGLSIVSNQLAPSSTALKTLYMPYRTYVDGWAEMKVTTGASVASHQTFLRLRRKADTDYLAIGARSTSTQFGIFTVLGGTVTAKTTVSQALSTATTYWIRGRVEGNVVTAQIWNTDPALGGSPLQTVTHTLTSTDITALGAAITGNSGLHLTPGGTDWRYDYVDFRGLNVGDFMVPDCQKFAKIEGSEQFDGLYYRKPFMLTLRSSSAVLLSRMEASLSGAVAAAALTFPGGGTGIPFPGSGGLVFGVSLGTATNLGYSRTLANVLLTGPLTNPAVVNLTNGRRVVIAGSLLTGESLTIDSRLRTVVDGLGANRYDLTGAENDWLLLEKGANVIATGADAIGGNVTVSWRHAAR